jgi:hypothetical protein
MELFGFGQRVDLKQEMNSTGIVTFFNSNSKEKFTIKLNREDYDQFWKAKDFVTNVMKEYGKDNNFWSILGEKLNDEYGVIEFQQKETRKVNNSSKKAEPKKSNDNIPQIEMTANYAQINFKGSIVEVVFTNNTETITATFKYRRSWSNKKYIDTVFDKSNIKPSWEFRYGWEYIGA